MPLTASGKIDRKALLLQVEPKKAGEGLPAKSLRDAVVLALASVSVAQVDWSASLASLGVDSVSAAPLADRLSQDVLGGREEVPLDILLGDGSLSDLCAYLAERRQLLRFADMDFRPSTSLHYDLPVS
eukprot:g22981.t1